MKKGTKQLLVGLAIGGALVGGYFYFRKPKNGEKLDSMTRGDESTEDESTESPFPLELGSKGEEVKILQQYLNRSSSCKERLPKPSPTARIRQLLPLEEDGIFGEKTETVVRICYSSGSINDVTYQTMKSALNKMTIDK